MGVPSLGTLRLPTLPWLTESHPEEGRVVLPRQGSTEGPPSLPLLPGLANTSAGCLCEIHLPLLI